MLDTTALLLIAFSVVMLVYRPTPRRTLAATALLPPSALLYALAHHYREAFMTALLFALYAGFTAGHRWAARRQPDAHDA
ncbi:hypothetical protein ACFQ9Z_35960 [Streptomyces sp. NPDC056580]|uniref:hypothetical protein n=1 Tax=Streptomyces sp. NPDC056580 TaxID=3345872 RepID=UPI0036958DDA